jgi:hypothetical protein
MSGGRRSKLGLFPHTTQVKPYCERGAILLDDPHSAAQQFWGRYFRSLLFA